MQGTLKGSGIIYNCIKAKARTKGQKASPHLAQQEKVNVLRHANEGGEEEGTRREHEDRIAWLNLAAAVELSVRSVPHVSNK